MTKTAKDRKRKAKGADKKVTRRAGRMTTHRVKPTKVPKRVNPAFFPKMRKPEPLSDRALWSEYRPDEIHPAMWGSLFTDDETLWEAIHDEAIEAVEAGEIPKYDGPANEARRRLRELQGVS